MKTFIAIVVAVLCGLSFKAGVMHGRGELTPAVEAKLRAARDWLVSKLPARFQKYVD